MDRSKRRRVVGVADEPRMARLFSSALEEAGDAATEVGDGASGLDAVRAQSPDLVVLDRLLPALNGWPYGAAVRVHDRGVQGSLGEGARARVLVVDDEPDVQRTLAEALTDEGYAVRAAGSGVEGLEVARVWRPDVILLDLLMPTMNGWQFAEAFGELPGPRVPIVVITAAGPGAIRSVQNLGTFAAVLAKPLNLSELLETVGRHVARREWG